MCSSDLARTGSGGAAGPIDCPGNLHPRAANHIAGGLHGGCQRNLQVHGRPAAGGLENAHAAAVVLDDRQDDRQTQAGTAQNLVIYIFFRFQLAAELGNLTGQILDQVRVIINTRFEQCRHDMIAGRVVT